VEVSVAVRRYRTLVRGLWGRYREAELGLNAAAVAYNGFLALVPLGVALLGVAAFVGADRGALDRVTTAMAAYAPEAVVTFVTDLLEEVGDRIGGQQGWLIPVSVLLALALGSRAVVALQKALARVEDRTERRSAVQLRLLGTALTIGGGAALLVSSLLLVAGGRGSGFLAELTGVEAIDVIWTWLRVPVSAAGLFLFLLAFYRWGPPEPLPRTWVAALVASAGVVLASLGFGLYLSLTPSLGATFGVLGAVAVMLVWLYMGAFAILFGALFVTSMGAR
jgi:membrane protein